MTEQKQVIRILVDGDLCQRYRHWCIDQYTSMTQPLRGHIAALLDGSHEKMVADRALLLSLCNETDTNEILAMLDERRLELHAARGMGDET